jgi:hypothetical protein
MNNKQYEYLPKVSFGETNDNYCSKVDIVGNSPCPCCGCITKLERIMQES